MEAQHRHSQSPWVLAAIAALGITAGLPRAACAGVDSIAVIRTDYGIEFPEDGTTLHIDNTSAFDLADTAISGTQISGTHQGATGTISTLGIIPAHTGIDYGWIDPSMYGGVFATHFKDTQGSGEVEYTISALWKGCRVTATFSPSSNATGGFVPFLGNDSSGNAITTPGFSSPYTVVAYLSALPTVDAPPAVTVFADPTD